MSARNVGGFIVLLAAALASWYLASTLREAAPQPQPAARSERGFYLRDARILGTGETGQLMYQIEADYAEQRSDDRIAFDNVRIRYSPASDVPWSISADQAMITGNRQTLTLAGHVLAVSAEGFSGNATEIRTDWLELEPEDYRAYTDRRVQIRIGERSLTATGMEALLRENRVELKSNVSGKFLP